MKVCTFQKRADFCGIKQISAKKTYKLMSYTMLTKSKTLDNMLNKTKSIIKGVSLTALFMTLGIGTAAGQTYYGLFPSEEASDQVRKMKKKDESNVAHWKLDKTVTQNTTISLRNSDSELSVYNQGITELSNPVEIPCVTPNREFRMTKPICFRDMGLSVCDTLDRLNIWLSFKPSGAPDTLFIGVRPSAKSMFTFPKPEITLHSNNIDNQGVFTKGAALSFEAQLPVGIGNNELEWEWYVDGEHMTGRSDRWFETYSRTKWKDGKHVIGCRYKKKKGHRYSPMGTVEIRQMSTSEKKVRVIPYWGADCTDEENLDSTNFCYNDQSRWGSFVLHPLEDYVHFYMEFLNEDIQTFSITNTAKVSNFELLESSDADKNYMFFNLPTNCKGHAREPYTPVTIYFRLEGKNINYSLIPFAKPKVTLYPDSVEICENSFESATDNSEFKVNVKGLTEGTFTYQWFFSPTKNGQYRQVCRHCTNKFVPGRTGYYKVLVTDGVFSAYSEPKLVKNRQGADCVTADIYTKEGRDYVCEGSTLEMRTRLVGENYRYQWKVGNINGDSLRNIPEAKSDYFYGTINKPGEAYFLEVRQGGRKVVSNPFQIKELGRINPQGGQKLIGETSASEVCMDYNVTLKAQIRGNQKEKPYIYRFYQSNVKEPVLLKEIESDARSVYYSTPVHSNGSNYYVIAQGCDNQLRTEKNSMVVNIRTDGQCGSGNFYVKKSGDDYRDGTSWENAFATVGKAIKTIKDMRKSMIYANTPMAIHIASGIYAPENENGFEFPDNVTIYGGYDDMPTDGTLSGLERKPLSPANFNGFATTFRSDSASQRIVNLVDKKDVKFVGIHFKGDKLPTSIDGRAVNIDNSSVTLDSCWFTEFRIISSATDPLAAVTIRRTEKAQRNDIEPELNIFNTTFSKNAGGEWGGTVNIMTDAHVAILNSTFNHNTNRYKGGTALLSYNASPSIDIQNSTFYNNSITEPGGSYGSSVMRFVGGSPICTIVSSTICDHFYKEAGKLHIYNSIVECAGKADTYRNNFPVKSTFVEEQKDDEYNQRRFGANFKGNTFNKISTVDNCITQVLIPSNKLEILGQGGTPNFSTPTDQRGVLRNTLACTYGAYEPDYSVAIDYSKTPECDGKKTTASFKSAVSGLTNVTYQWVNNYSDIEGQTSDKLVNTGLGTYWLEIKGKDRKGKEVSISSSEFRVSDICEVPGEFFVNQKDGNDGFPGTTWNKAVQTIDQALRLAAKFRANNKNHITIFVNEGTYTPSTTNGYLLKDLQDITIKGGYPQNPAKEDPCMPKMFTEGMGNEIILQPKDVKGRIFDLGKQVKGLRIVGLHLKGRKGQLVSGGAMNISGAEVTIDSCWISGFNDASVTQDGLNTTINIASTSKVNICNSFITENTAKQGAGISINGNGNTSEVNIYNTTFYANNSLKTGGAALLINNNAEPFVRMMNTTFFSNRCSNQGIRACSSIRLNGRESTILQLYNSTIYGTCMTENGMMQLFNSLVEATSSNVEKKNSVVADDELINIDQDVDIKKHRRFADSFRYALDYNCGFIPTLLLKKGGDEEITKKVKTIDSVSGFSLTKDACGNDRGEESCMGAAMYEQEQPAD